MGLCSCRLSNHRSTDGQYVRTIRHRTVWFGYWAILLTLTHLPPSKTIRIPGGWVDDVLHMLFFMLLGVLGAWAVPIRKMAAAGTLALGLMGYAAVDEWTQAWTGRTPDFNDWLADAVGIVAGVALYLGCATLQGKGR